jgi:hypothetical protein
LGGSGAKLPYLGILEHFGQKLNFSNIFPKNEDTRMVDSSLEVYWQNGSDKKNQCQIFRIFGGYGAKLPYMGILELFGSKIEILQYLGR